MTVIFDSLLIGLLIGLCTLVGQESGERVFSFKFISKNNHE